MKRPKHIDFLLSIYLLAGCSQYLDIKPDDKLAIPSSVEDLQLILDSYVTMNNSFPVAGEVMSDHYYVSTEIWASRNERERNYYLWLPEINDNTAWASGYRAILGINTVLDNLEKHKANVASHPVKGRALFLRAYRYYSLAQLYVPPYEVSTINASLGLPLRLDADFEKPSIRSSIEETYTQIIRDLENAVQLLPLADPLKTRPTKVAAYGALAKVYLSMKKYDKAGLYADSCLQFYETLMDFNGLNPLAPAPIARFNEEVIFHARSPVATIMSSSMAMIDSVLYQSYHDDDLRKSIYYSTNTDGSAIFKGDYDGSGVSSHFAFWGITTGEMYLIRAECYARQNKVSEALTDINTLLAKRWRINTFTAHTATLSDVALDIILDERRKELVFRGTRWIDLRRFISEPQHTVVPHRNIEGINYQLLPDNSTYTLKIPQYVISYSNIVQNP